MASIENSEHGLPKHSGTADLIVKGAIALITAAFFVAAYLQFQMSFWLALLGALSVYVMLVLAHVLRRRSEREKDLVYEVSRLEGEVARLKVTPPATAPTPAARTGAGARAAKLAAPPPVAPSPSLPAGMKATVPPAPPAAPPPATHKTLRPGRPAAEKGVSERAPRLMSHRPGAPAGAPTRPEPSLSVAPLSVPPQPSAAPASERMLRAEPPQADIPPMPTLPDWSAPAAAAAPAGDRKMHDYWPSASKPSVPEGPRVELPPLANERETDLDAVHGMIKRLANEVSVGGEPTLDGLPSIRPETALRASLDALQTTASAMRATSQKKGAGPSAPSAPRGAGPTPPPIMPSHARLAALAEAVSAGRIDVALSPIVGLADHQTHYYEVVARPLDERGMVLPAGTRDPQLALAGLLPLLDRARLRQAAHVAGSLAEEGRETCLFAAASSVSLANDGFLDELADAYRGREALANELVLTFAQADVRTFGGPEWSGLTDMRDLGFRFGVEDVSDFDYEFTALCAAGFAFVKMDAATLLAGLPSPSGPMAAEEVCRNLNELGLTLVVGNVNDEETRDRVLAAGVPLGQGVLFGAPAAGPGDAFAAAGDAAA